MNGNGGRVFFLVVGIGFVFKIDYFMNGVTDMGYSVKRWKVAWRSWCLEIEFFLTKDEKE